MYCWSCVSVVPLKRRSLERGVDGGSVQAGAWTAILDLAGEAYQAFFDSQGAAFEALNAAGVAPPKVPHSVKPAAVPAPMPAALPRLPAPAVQQSMPVQ